MDSAATAGISTQPLELLDWGGMAYGEALQRQKAAVAERIGDACPDRLVFVEHPPVITIGRSGGKEDLRVSETMLRQQGMDLYRVDRGGMATFHGPGQMVAYPILKLKHRDLHRYLRTLQHVLADVIKAYGLIPEERDGHPGVWVGSAKIASIGIAVRKWVTYHGVALNVNTDPQWFRWIVPCGHSDERITSMDRELGRSIPMAEVRQCFLEAFCRRFGYAGESLLNASLSKHPSWLIRPAPSAVVIQGMEEKLLRLRLSTVCQSAHCPNMGECFGRGTATFMILGTRCTRRCRFCAVDQGRPYPPDPQEPERVAEAAEILRLKHVVVTSVTRDDLLDGGAGHFVRTVEHIKRRCNGARIEVLIPDFQGSLNSLQQVCDSRPDVLNHNLETVPRLYPFIRPLARYRRSLGVLEYAAAQGFRVKSGLMLGLGETDPEILETLKDLRRTGCTSVTIGQYLAPSRDHAPVRRFVPPEAFEAWAEKARSLGFKGIASGPLVRSSYRAEDMFST
jgi:lipoic acid synthetase